MKTTQHRAPNLENWKHAEVNYIRNETNIKNEPRVQTPRAKNNQDASVFITCWAFETANDPSTPVGRICLQCLCRKMKETSTQCHTPQKALNGKPCSILQGQWMNEPKANTPDSWHCWRFETDGPTTSTCVELFARFVRVKSTISTNYEHYLNHIRWGANPEPKAMFTAIADSLKPQTIPLLFAMGRFCLHGV